MTEWTRLLDYSKEVESARERGSPIVALESTIITHGMPYPQNLETALLAEQAARDEGAVPATIAVMDGRVKVGLEKAQLESLARHGQDAIKVSRRDLPFVIHSGAHGGTTVASTMLIAALAGIRVFSTGGIGGVHRGAEKSMDVSADLQELSKTDVAVVCAGPKSILDIALTLEYLETHGVAVVGYQTDELPAFFTSKSGFPVDYRLDSAADIASILRIKWSMGLSGGLVIANPIPEAYSIDRQLIESHIDRAVSEAASQSVVGKELSPFLLRRVKELSGGDSLNSNIQLVLNNVRLGAQIAVSLLNSTDADIA